MSALREKRRAQLESVIDTLDLASNTFNILSIDHEEAGAIDIIRRIMRDKYDLILKQVWSDVDTADDERFNGFDFQLLRKCPCPVWLHRTPRNADQVRVLAALGPCKDNPDDLSMNKRTIETGLELNAALEAPLHVVPCYSGLKPSLLGEGMSRKEFDAAQGEIKDRATDAFNEFMGQYPSFDQEPTHLLCGAPSEQITSLVEQLEITNLLMGTVARRGVPGLLIGNTAERALNQVSCSVITFKPEEFQSPIRLS